MTPIDLGFLVLSVLFCAAFFLLGAVSGRFHRDEIFAGATPGTGRPLTSMLARSPATNIFPWPGTLRFFSTLTRCSQ